MTSTVTDSNNNNNLNDELDTSNGNEISEREQNIVADALMNFSSLFHFSSDDSKGSESAAESGNKSLDAAADTDDSSILPPQ